LHLAVARHIEALETEHLADEAAAEPATE
jgi:hypothetical protein